MSDLICPHCRGVVPRGAKVCRGCFAEIEYGASSTVVGIVILVSLILAFQTLRIVPESLSFLAWVVGLGSFIGGGIVTANMFGNRVRFKRVYHTR